MWSDKQHGVKTLVRILKDANNFVLVTIYENYTRTIQITFFHLFV